MSKTPTLASAKRIVIKIGSNLIAESARVRNSWLAAMAADIAALHAAGKEIIPGGQAKSFRCTSATARRSRCW